jgi:hypothetical protein
MLQGAGVLVVILPFITVEANLMPLAESLMRFVEN